VIRGEGYLPVGNTLLALQELAALHRTRLLTTMIAVTGSNGNDHQGTPGQGPGTTFKTASTQGNLNNHIGVPLTILSLDQETEIAVVEMEPTTPARSQPFAGSPSLISGWSPISVKPTSRDSAVLRE